MTVWFFVYSIVKRAKAIALVNSGVTENFTNLIYAKWLWLPIKQLSKPRKPLNVDGTENKSRELKHYTDLLVQTGKTYTTLCFYLSDLGEQKAILGYPWFAAIQPNIDWKRGWIDHTQLPIILWVDNAKWAWFIPRQRNISRTKGPSAYFIGRVLLHPQAIPAKPIPGVPAEFTRHRKVFSEEDFQRLLKHTVWDHAIELLPGVPNSLSG
jgi:hypothetical protein